MSRFMLSSDWHLGHANIHKFRKYHGQEFETAEEHHEFVFDRCASEIQKNDTLLLAGDISFTAEWLARIAEIKCRKKIIILGNHCTERVNISSIAAVFDAVHGLYSKRNVWFSHCPIHPLEFRGRTLNIHGHTHDRVIKGKKYFNICLEQTDFKPISFAEIMVRIK